MDNWKQYITNVVQGERLALTAIFFTMPLSPKVNTLFIILWALLSIINFKRADFNTIFKRKELLLYALVYVMLLIGFFYTQRTDIGASKMQTQVSLILFPLLLGSKSISPKERIWYLNSFVLGVLLTVLVCLAFNFYRFAIEGNFYILDAFNRKQYFFYYYRFSDFLDLHPTYFSLYLGLAIFYLLTLSAKQLGMHKGLKYLFVLVLLIANFLTASKAGLSTFFTITLFYYLVNYIYGKQRKSGWALVVMIGGLVLLFSTNTTSSKRFLQAFTSLDETFIQDKAANESTGIRLALWDLSFKVAKKALFMGHGTGSVVNVLNEHCIAYNSFSVCEGLRNKNCHNQYLNFLVSNGLFTLLLFVCALCIGFIRFVRQKDVIALFFVLLMASNFFFESMLQRERGVVFFMLFIVFFTSSQKPAKPA